jgi:anti-sigma regulatory factor (Ser/Thr protein kinase)
MSGMIQFEANFVSAPSAVADARHAVREFAVRAGLDPWDTSDVVLAAGEACNNAAEHAHVAGGRFTVRGVDDGNALAIEVTDYGGGFDLAGKGAGMDPEERGVRGLGIFLMRCLMDEVSYTTDGDGTTVRLVKRSPHRNLNEAV